MKLYQKTSRRLLPALVRPCLYLVQLLKIILFTFMDFVASCMLKDRPLSIIRINLKTIFVRVCLLSTLDVYGHGKHSFLKIICRMENIKYWLGLTFNYFPACHLFLSGNFRPQFHIWLMLLTLRKEYSQLLALQSYITDTPIIWTAAKSQAKVDHGCLTEINSRYYGLSLMLLLTQGLYGVRYKRSWL